MARLELRGKTGRKHLVDVAGWPIPRTDYPRAYCGFRPLGGWRKAEDWRRACPRCRAALTRRRVRAVRALERSTHP